MATASLATYPDQVATWLKANIAGLVTCEAYAGQFDEDAVERVTFRPPAIFIAILKAPVRDPGTEQLDLELEVMAIVLASAAGRGRDARESACAALAEELVLKARFNQWGFTWLSPAKVTALVQMSSLALDKKGLACWGVRWTQTIRVGTSIWDGGTVPETPLVGQAPDIGEGHEDDYEPVVPSE